MPYPGLDAAMYKDLANKVSSGDLLLKPHPFYYSALYGYFLGGLQTIWGSDPWIVHIANIIMGTLSILCIFSYTQSFFHSKKIAYLAAILAAFYGPFLVFDASPLKTTLGLFLISSALGLLSRTVEKSGFLRWLFIGILLGLALNLSAQVLLFILFLLGISAIYNALPRISFWSISGSGKSFGQFSTVLGLCAGLFLAIFPFALRNQLVTGELIFGNCTGGLHFYIANQTKAWGGYTPVPGIRPNPVGHFFDANKKAEYDVGYPLTYREVNQYWQERAFDEIISEPSTFLKLIGTKLLLIISPYEIPNNENYQFLTEHSRILPLLPSAGLILPLCFAGWFLAIYKRRGHLILHLYNLCVILALLFSLVTWRYRLPLLLGLIPFGGFLISEIIYKSTNRRNLHSLFPLLLVIIFWAMGHIHPIAKVRGPGDIRRAEMKMSRSQQILEVYNHLKNNTNLGQKERSFSWLRIAHLHSQQGDTEGAVRILENALDESPQDGRLLRYRRELILKEQARPPYNSRNPN